MWKYDGEDGMKQGCRWVAKCGEEGRLSCVLKSSFEIQVLGKS